MYLGMKVQNLPSSELKSGQTKDSRRCGYKDGWYEDKNEKTGVGIKASNNKLYE
jgi:hypothetical protein